MTFSSVSYLVPTAVIGGATGVSGVTTGSTSTGTAAAASGGDTSNNTPTPTPVVVGSVVGSVAGVAVIVGLLLWALLRWKRRKHSGIPLGSGGDPNSATGIAGHNPSTGPMTQRSLPFAIPAALASLTAKRRASAAPSHAHTVSSTAGSERGFYRVSGRKIGSVLETGGDGYGEPHGPHGENTLSGSSFYRDSRGFYGGQGIPSSPLASPSIEHDSAIPIMRPSPARTPVTAQGSWSPNVPPIDSPRRDPLGRSHPSHDGSHASKFTEEV